MKNKSSLALMEQLLMILVVALASALCLRAFLWSDQASREMEQRSQAVILCQNAAETIKASGSLESGAQALGAVRRGDAWLRQGEDFSLELRAPAERIPGLGQAEIRALSQKTGGVLFSITTGWQEVLP